MTFGLITLCTDRVEGFINISTIFVLQKDKKGTQHMSSPFDTDIK